MKQLLILLAILLAPQVAWPAAPKHVYAVGVCKQQTTDILEAVRAEKNTPEFQLVIVCDEHEWAQFKRKHGIRMDALADTMFPIDSQELPTVIFGPRAFENIREAVRHELAHLRCRCAKGDHF